MIAKPSRARQYSVWRATLSCNVRKLTLPTIGPTSVPMPPSSTMTSPSTERLIEIVSGEILPFENANRPPAIPQIAPAMTKAVHCTRTAPIPIASARSEESRTARIA